MKIRTSVVLLIPNSKTFPPLAHQTSLSLKTAETPRNACTDTIEQITENPNNDQSSIIQPKTQLGGTVVVRKKGKYGAQDYVDQFLSNQVAKHVKYDQLGSMSRDLGINDAEYKKITAPDTFSRKDTKSIR